VPEIDQSYGCGSLKQSRVGGKTEKAAFIARRIEPKEACLRQLTLLQKRSNRAILISKQLFEILN
jgi:hypothetical protein